MRRINAVGGGQASASDVLCIVEGHDGRVWADVAAGVNGDNSDNRWTDNVIGNEDDRHLNPAKPNLVQALFVAVQALAGKVYRQSAAS